MSTLIQTYSNACGVKIGKPYIKEKFFPMETGLYFTIQGSSGQAAKCYDYFSEVLDILAPFLKGNKISVVQLGAANDRPIPGCIHLMGKTSLQQSAYILQRAYLHLGNDSWLVHAAGALNVPVVALYGSTSSQVHGPYFRSARTELIDSHRNGNTPSYSAEHNKSVNLIPPEDIAEAVLRICGISNKVAQKTLFIGGAYTNPSAEYVPNFVFNPQAVNNQPVSMRLDYHHDENILAQSLSLGTNGAIFCNRPITLALVNKFKAQIQAIVYEINDATTPEYLKSLKQTGVKLRLISRELDAEKLSETRMKFFSVSPAIEFVGMRSKEQAVKDFNNYAGTPIELGSKLYYRSTKFIFSEGKTYASKAGWLRNQPIPHVDQNVQVVIDAPEFWDEIQYFRIFKNLNETPPQ